MKKSKDEKVQNFLEKMLVVDEEQLRILQELRGIVFRVYPKTNERIMYGGIMFSLNDDFGGIFVRKNHVSFEFGIGYKMDDPDGLLEGKGQFRRHLKIRSFSDIKDKRVKYFVEQAV